jgi:hypothetical protein
MQGGGNHLEGLRMSKLTIRTGAGDGLFPRKHPPVRAGRVC